MSYKEQIQQNNENLQGLINKANSLPDAGGSGGSVEIGVFTIDSLLHHPGDGCPSGIVEFPFVVGQTWGDWIDSPLNIPYVDYQVGGIKRITFDGATFTFMSIAGLKQVSADNTVSGVVSADDIIQSTTYYGYINASDFPM